MVGNALEWYDFFLYLRAEWRGGSGAAGAAPSAAGVASVFAGGLSPLVATALLRQYRSAWPVALLLIAMGLITTISLLFTREPTRTSRAGTGVGAV